MVETIYKKVIKFIDSNRISLFVFFSSLFILISLSGTRLFLSDEGVILDQFYNLINGSLAIKIAKINTVEGVFILIGNNLYGIYSYSLLILSLPIYYILRTVDSLYSAHLFILQLWALSGGVIVYLIAKIRNLKHALAGGLISYAVLIAASLYYFKPIYFPMWGELLSVEFTNILITAFLALTVFVLFKNFFSNKIALFASFFVILMTPISFYALTLKHHNLAVFLTLLTFYFFYKYYEIRDNKFIYFAYISAGLCLWTRVLDGAIILASLLIVDVIFFRRSIKYIFSISVIILISLIPFFSFNYLILGNPVSIIENTPLANKPVTLLRASEFISLAETPDNAKQIELLNKLGYTWTAKIRGDRLDILGYMMFFKLVNTFGVFLVSPFLISALVFLVPFLITELASVINSIERKIKLNTRSKFFELHAAFIPMVDRIKREFKFNAMDKFFGLFFVLYISVYLIYKNFILAIIKETPAVLEYRYLLIIYVIMLYFALRINKVRDLIENKFKTIILLCCVIIIVTLIYFIGEFPVRFMDIYYMAALITSISLIIVLSISLLIFDKRAIAVLLDKILTSIIALSLAQAFIFLIFYYWIESMTYISPSQNYSILPIMESILKWTYQTVLK